MLTPSREMIVILKKQTSSNGLILRGRYGAVICCVEDFSDSPDVSTEESNLDAMRMKSGFRKDISNDASCQSA
jgi:hypothetical protein